MNNPFGSVPTHDYLDTVELWPERSGGLRQEVRVPANSQVLAKPIGGKPRLCLTRNVSGGGLCLRWPQAPLRVDDVIKLAFLRAEDGVTSFVHAAGVVKWCSATEVGLAYSQAPVKPSNR